MQFASESTLAVVLQVLALMGAVGLLLTGIYLARKATRDTWGKPELVGKYTRPIDWRREAVRGALWVFAIALFAIVYFQPMGAAQLDQINAGSTVIVGVTDVSWSMEAEDYRGVMPDSPPGSTVATGESGSRIDMAGYLITQMMKTAAGNKIGLVTYMGAGWPLFDPVSDFAGLRVVMDNGLFGGNAPGGGSDTSAGLMQAVKMIDKYVKDYPKDASMAKVIVLFSDGGFDGKDDDLQKTLDEMSKRQIRLVVVGLGSHVDVPLPIYDANTGVFQQYRKIDAKESSQIDEKFLQKLATDARGEYHYVPPGQTSLDVRWSSALGAPEVQPHSKPLYKGFALVAFILLIANCLPGLSRKRAAKK